jgi:hypothetical protein
LRAAGVRPVIQTAVAAGIVVSATLEQRGGDLSNATFDEVHCAGAPPRLLARSTCLLRRTEGRPAAHV